MHTHPHIQGLFLAVYAAPNERAPREVLADALLELGEVRGEFIALQLDGSVRARKRSAKLLNRHRAQFLGPLGAAVVPGTDVWRAGFLAAGRVRLTGTLVDEASWATVEHLELITSRWPPSELASSHLRALRRLELLPRSISPYGELGAEDWRENQRALEVVRALLIEGRRPKVLREGAEWARGWGSLREL